MFPFIALPLEIRQQIYQQVIYQYDLPDLFTAARQRTGLTAAGFPTCFNVSRQVRSEAENVFLVHGSCRVYVVEQADRTHRFHIPARYQDRVQNVRLTLSIWDFFFSKTDWPVRHPRDSAGSWIRPWTATKQAEMGLADVQGPLYLPRLRDIAVDLVIASLPADYPLPVDRFRSATAGEDCFHWEVLDIIGGARALFRNAEQNSLETQDPYGCLSSCELAIWEGLRDSAAYRCVGRFFWDEDGLPRGLQCDTAMQWEIDAAAKMVIAVMQSAIDRHLQYLEQYYASRPPRRRPRLRSLIGAFISYKFTGIGQR